MSEQFSRNGMTMRTPAGPVDLVPLYRRLEGDAQVRVVDDEKSAAILALTHLGVAMYQINKVVNMSGTSTRAVLDRYGIAPVLTAPTFSWTALAYGPQRRAA